MPVYVYRCEDCGTEIEKRQSFHDAPLTECEQCHGRLRKVFQPTPIVFKGSGFYATDHRSPSGSNGGNGSSTKGENGKGEDGKGADGSASSSSAKETGTAAASAQSD